ncbi:hypothetical protein SAMN05443575_0870 [Jatrophihabitans endophyticus]|uniref:DUF3800 domain-containing protein n=1 Tax=Jatrophihabitans endophyticus TaxID=1206085 RepID=A0A1M5EEJ8_9ACTN|nr:hypothetical protein [Jatrophihabitans endophyticus]SHF77607.1 hypothetical protein SAMN05443575_0870 [Jatrophihabitans endophyticus]
MHAFVDESARGGLTICVAIVAPTDAASVRSALRQLLAPGQQRLHMTKESAPRRRLILARLCEQPLEAMVYESAYRVHREGRADIMRRIVANPAIDRLTIESAVGQDEHDVRAIQAEVHRLGRHEELHYEHREPRHEPLLRAADAVVFAYAAGGELRRRCESLIGSIEVVEPHA